MTDLSAAHDDGLRGFARDPSDAGGSALDFAAVFAALPGIDLVLAPDAPRYTMLAATKGRLAATMTTREGTLGRPLFEVFPDANPANDAPSGVGNLRASLDTVLRTRTPHRMATQRYDLERPDGTWEERYWAPLNVPVLGVDGAVRYIIHRVEDVTEVMRLAAEGDRLRGAYAGSERARTSAEAARDVIAAANEQLQDQALELELANQQLQEQAVELEAQADELVETAVERERLLVAERAARAEAEAAARTKADFLATMSHEFRTPINAMIGYTQLLEMGLAGPLTAQQRTYLDRLTLSGQHLHGLVSDVLDLSRIEAGQTRVAHADAWTGPPVRGALDLVAPAAGARGVRLVDARPDEAGVPYVGDDDRTRQVVLNLLSNAVKFTAPGGTITVDSGTLAEGPPAAAHLRGAGPWAFVRVADTGVGIAPEEQGRIFEPFHQVDGRTNPYTRTAGGTGLGLAISRRLARLMGGDLTVESRVGEGAVFTLWLPAAHQAYGAQDETADTRSARAERDLGRLEVPGLGEVGTLLRGAVEDVLTAYADRLRADPAVPGAPAMRRVELEDHAVSFLADLAQSLVIVENAGPEAADLLRDGSAIQRAIAQAHGARRHAQGWGEESVRRDQQLFREEVERAVRGGLRAGTGDARDAGVDDAVRVLLGLIDRAEAISVAAWRRAAASLGSAGAGRAATEGPAGATPGP